MLHFMLLLFLPCADIGGFILRLQLKVFPLIGYLWHLQIMGSLANRCYTFGCVLGSSFLVLFVFSGSMFPLASLCTCVYMTG